MAAPILVVDDNASNRELVTWLLRARGYDVRAAADGPEMYAVLAGFRPRLVLMDVQLPGTDGLELTRRLKADPATRDLLVVAVTAYAMKGDEERILAAGCDAYVSKPIDVRALPLLVAELLARSGPP
jgi:two-component system cell cycle response regulator DivK